MNCARVKAAVSGFEAEFGGQVRVYTIPVDTPEGQAAVKKYDFQSHGLVMFDPAGQLIHKRRDHMAKADEVHQILAHALRPLRLDGGA
jgi:hypothetical protein